MSLTVNKQHLDFIKKHIKVRASVKKDKTTGAAQHHRFDMPGDLKDIAKIQDLRQGSESGRARLETDDKNVHEVKKLLTFAVKLLSSEKDTSRLEKIYGFRQENLVKLLSVHP